jgi:hypothetical protein
MRVTSEAASASARWYYIRWKRRRHRIASSIQVAKVHRDAELVDVEIAILR